MRCAGHVALVDETRNIYKNLVGKSEVKQTVSETLASQELCVIE
jgi:hypothetical protein